MSQSNDPGNVVIQSCWSGLQLSQMMSKMQESKAKTRRLSLPGGRKDTKNDHLLAQVLGVWGFFPCFLKQTPPYSPLPSPLVLRQLHLVDHWELGFIQHLKICLLRLLLEALAKFLTNKHLPAKLKMELLIK